MDVADLVLSRHRAVMGNAVTTPIFVKRIIRSRYPVRAARPTATLTWIWSGLVTPPDQTYFPIQYPINGGSLLSMSASLGEPDTVSGYSYSIRLLANGSIVGALTLPGDSALTVTDSSLTPAAIESSAPLRPWIDGQPWAGAYDLTITVGYEYAAVA